MDDLSLDEDSSDDLAISDETPFSEQCKHASLSNVVEPTEKAFNKNSITLDAWIKTLQCVIKKLYRHMRGDEAAKQKESKDDHLNMQSDGDKLAYTQVPWAKSEELVIQLKSLKTDIHDENDDDLYTNAKTRIHEIVPRFPLLVSLFDDIVTDMQEESKFKIYNLFYLMVDLVLKLQEMPIFREVLTDEEYVSIGIFRQSEKKKEFINIHDVNDKGVYDKLKNDIVNILEAEKLLNEHALLKYIGSARFSGSMVDGISTPKWFASTDSAEVEMDFMHEFGVYPKELKFLFQPIKDKGPFVAVTSNRIHETIFKISQVSKKSKKVEGFAFSEHVSLFSHCNGFIDSLKFRQSGLSLVLSKNSTEGSR